MSREGSPLKAEKRVLSHGPVAISSEVRMQCAALCHRRNRGRTEVLLVTSRETGRWVLPKGWPCDGLDHSAAAAREAWEEAGVEGRIFTECTGVFTYTKVLSPGVGVPCVVSVFPLRVKRLAHKFPERKERRRKWFPLKKAAANVAEADLRLLIAGFDATRLEK